MANSTHNSSPRSHGIHTQSNPGLRSATDAIKDFREELPENVKDGMKKATDIADQASDVASEFYENATTWLNSNYGRVITGVAIVSAIGVFGYFLGRKSSSNYLD